MTPTISPLTHADLEEWYGDKGRGPTMKGIAGRLDGELIAVAGFVIVMGQVVAFCDLKPQARPWKAAIHRTAVSLIREASARHRRILAYCDGEEAGSSKWLRRLGFQPDEKDVWVLEGGHGRTYP